MDKMQKINGVDGQAYSRPELDGGSCWGGGGGCVVGKIPKKKKVAPNSDPESGTKKSAVPK